MKVYGTVILVLFFGLLGNCSSQKEKTQKTEKLQLIKFEEPVKLSKIGNHKLLGPSLVDVNGDGKLDVLAGVFEGHFLLRINEGTKKEPKFKSEKVLQSSGKNIRLKHW